MMSPATIARMTEEAEERARAEGIEPHVINSLDEIDDYPPFPFKFIGRNVKGWELLDEHFVDSSGFGADDEPAMTVPRFIRELRLEFMEHSGQDETYGYGITSCGQFQVYVGVFRKEE